jgi:hypothetical protein
MSALPKSPLLAKGWEAVLAAERLQRIASAMDVGDVKPIFRRFGSLNTINLLVLQAELAELQDRFFALSLQQTDAESEDIATYYMGMRQPGYDNKQRLEEQAKQKGDLLTKMQEALKTYSELDVPQQVLHA